MENGRCGKSCEECAVREEQACPACQAGPGFTCEIASCCREKGHASCDTCTLQSSCGLLRGKDDAPARRQQLADRKQARENWLDDHAPMLGKWLWVLFWLMIFSIVTNLLSADQVVARLPALELPGAILSAVVSVAYGVILFKLSPVCGRYKTSGICHLVGAGLALAAELLANPDSTALGLLFLLPAMIISMYSTYQEYHAHAEVLDGFDDDLAEKWRKLWKWEIGTLGVLFGSILVMLIIPMLGLLVLLAAVIALLVLSILEYVYLYRMANRFRERAERISVIE